MTRPMFPHAVDSTMLAAFRSCPQKMFRTYVEHWKPKAESVHLVAGGAFAKGIEVARKAFYDGVLAIPEVEMIDTDDGLVRKVRWTEQHIAPGNREDSEAAGLQALLAAYGDFECPSDSAKSLERTAGALEFYFTNYPLGADGLDPVLLANGTRAIEFSFAEPLSIVHPVTGDPILYTGRSDCIGEFAGAIYAVDEKTTSSLGASWSRQWEMRGQFTGYVWAARQAGLDVKGAMVRGVSILKTKYDTQQVVTYRSQHEIDLWMRQTERDLERMIQCWEDGYWDYAIDHACQEYCGCSMVQICKSPTPESWLPMSFEKRVWDPLARRELSVEQWEASWGHAK